MIFLMDLPAPVHGMSNVNASIKRAAVAEGINIQVINTVPSYAAKFFPGKVWFVVKLLHTFVTLFRLIIALASSRSKTLYRPVNGGSGQIFDLLYLGCARLFNTKVFIHHHSFNYLNDYSALFNFLNKLAGKSAVHIVLGHRMTELLNKHYGIKEDNTRLLSNLAFFEAELETSVSKDDTIIIGHLANLCAEKGLDLFIDVCSHLKSMDLPFKAKIAGPFVNEEAKKLVMDSLKSIPEIDYVGPVYAQDKEAFYKTLDCFIFPSKYKNEAEPLVLYEAAMYGGYLVGTQRGCMQSVIDGLSGYSMEETSEVAELIASDIKHKCAQNSFNENSKAQRISLFKQQQLLAKQNLQSFLKEMEVHAFPTT